MVVIIWSGLFVAMMLHYYYSLHADTVRPQAVGLSHRRFDVSALVKLFGAERRIEVNG
jgi:hypothetical protein